MAFYNIRDISNNEICINTDKIIAVRKNNVIYHNFEDMEVKYVDSYTIDLEPSGKYKINITKETYEELIKKLTENESDAQE